MLEVGAGEGVSKKRLQVAFFAGVQIPVKHRVRVRFAC
jgi:hypothetical protein